MSETTKICKHAVCILPPPSKILGYKLSFIQSLQLAFRSMRGVKLYYITNMSGAGISHVFLKHNYMNKYAFMNQKDVMVNPYWTVPEERNKGFAKRLLRTILSDSKESWTRCYAVVANDNSSSIRCLEAVGFSRIGYAEAKRWSYQLTSTPGKLVVFMYARGD